MDSPILAYRISIMIAESNKVHNLEIRITDESGLTVFVPKGRLEMYASAMLHVVQCPECSKCPEAILNKVADCGSSS